MVLPCAWSGDLAGFRALDPAAVEERCRPLVALLQEALARGSIDERAWVVLDWRLRLLGRRIDAVVATRRAVLAVQFRPGQDSVRRADLVAAEDAALDLAEFDDGCRGLPVIAVVLVPNGVLVRQQWPLPLAGAAAAFGVSRLSLPRVLEAIGRFPEVGRPMDWSAVSYAPVAGLIEAARALYAGHDVSALRLAEAGPAALRRAMAGVAAAVAEARARGGKVVVFVTGSPGAGKTVCGLDLAFGSAGAAYLTANPALVHVLREALVRDAAERGMDRRAAARRMQAVIQALPAFRDHFVGREDAPPARLVVIDEAQRCWAGAHAVRKTRNRPVALRDSEAGHLLDVMDRVPGWAAVVCLVGGGQEIHDGEGGLAAWGEALRARPHWSVWAPASAMMGAAGWAAAGAGAEGIAAAAAGAVVGTAAPAGGTAAAQRGAIAAGTAAAEMAAAAAARVGSVAAVESVAAAASGIAVAALVQTTAPATGTAAAEVAVTAAVGAAPAAAAGIGGVAAVETAAAAAVETAAAAAAETAAAAAAGTAAPAAGTLAAEIAAIAAGTATAGPESAAAGGRSDGRRRLSGLAGVRVADALELRGAVRAIGKPLAVEWVAAVLADEPERAADLARGGEVPFTLTRSLEAMREVIREASWGAAREVAKAGGTRSAGLLASSTARRLRAEGLGAVLAHQDETAVARWFLDRWPDVRSSDALEVVGTEFAVQGLELDRVGVCWDGDLVRGLAPGGDGWQARRFRASGWTRALGEARANRINAYRVLLTRARRGTVIWVPLGDRRDPTREPRRYDAVAAYLSACGAGALDVGALDVGALDVGAAVAEDVRPVPEAALL